MNSWKRKLRMGMVGGGQGAFIGAVHRTAARLDNQVQLVAGCFSSDSKNTEFTGRELRLDPARCYGSYSDMAEAEARLPPDARIDFISIVTPNSSHFSIAKTFLEAGFHVVCDKPMTVDAIQAEQLALLVERTGLVFALTHNYSAYPLVRHARELFRNQQLGVLRKLIVEYLQDWLRSPLELTGMKQAVWRVDPAQTGAGGAIGDLGTHAFHLAEYVTGDRVIALCADASTFLPGRAIYEDANVLLQFESGGKGVLAISQVATGEDNNLRLHAYASEGAVAWAQESPDELQVCRPGQPSQIVRRGHGEYLSPAAMNATRLPMGHPEGFLEAFANVYADAIRAIRAHIDGAPLPLDQYDCPTVYDGLRGMRFVAAAVDSTQRGGVWVPLEG